MKMLRALVILTVTGSLITDRLRADGPALISYQGRVVVGNVNFNGVGQFKFALVNANGTTTYWSNNGSSTSGSEPSAAVSLTVTNGLYSVLLGDTTLGMAALPATAFAQADLRLRVWFNDGSHGSQLLSPDQRLAPSAYLASGSVTASDLAVSASPSSGQVLGYNGTNLSWTNNASGGFALNGTNSYYSGGNVGIGTSSPAAALEVSGSNGNALLYATASRPTMWFRDTAAANASSVIGGFNGGLRFYTDAWEKNTNPNAVMTLDSPSGFLGIGTTSPQAALQITNLGPPWTSNGWAAAAEFDNAAAIGWRVGSNNLRFGIGHTGGGLFMFHTQSDPGNTASPAVYDLMIADSGNVGIGTIGPSGKLHLYNASTSTTQIIESAGPNNSFSELDFKNGNGTWYVGTVRGVGNDALYFTRLNGFGPILANFTLQKTGDAVLAGTLSTSGLSVDGTATVNVLTITGGSDVAEPFAMGEQVVEKGAVVVIDPDHPGRLKPSYRAYDRRVAGIVSGANGINPGIALHQRDALEGGQNVALSGRVYVQAETSGGFIEPGDLLTTSDVPGYAMKATDRERAQGAIIGKAMTSLSEERGKVLVLVSLQ